jgi:hypothetical protein
MSHDEDLASEEYKCPICGERRIDFLIWIDDDTLECATCHVRYRPPDAPEDRGPFSVN